MPARQTALCFSRLDSRPMTILFPKSARACACSCSSGMDVAALQDMACPSVIVAVDFDAGERTADVRIPAVEITANGDACWRSLHHSRVAGGPLTEARRGGQSC